MKHGDQKKIAAILGISKEHVNKFFNKKRGFSTKLSKQAAMTFPEVPFVLWALRDLEAIKEKICIPSDIP